jgi:hypothetical protein
MVDWLVGGRCKNTSARYCPGGLVLVKSAETAVHLFTWHYELYTERRKIKEESIHPRYGSTEQPYWEDSLLKMKGKGKQELELDPPGGPMFDPDG